MDNIRLMSGARYIILIHDWGNSSIDETANTSLTGLSRYRVMDTRTSYDPKDDSTVYSYSINVVNSGTLLINNLNIKNISRAFAINDGNTLYVAKIYKYGIKFKDMKSGNYHLEIESSDRTLPNFIYDAKVLEKNNSDKNEVDIKLLNKYDNYWYRMTTTIPNDMYVNRICRADGVNIENNGRGYNSSKGYENILNWYQVGNTVYFFDDPVNGYSVEYSPPRANNSILVEVARSGTNAYCGQISAIVFPYSGGTPQSQYDHTGRSEDNGLGNNIDADEEVSSELEQEIREFI